MEGRKCSLKLKVYFLIQKRMANFNNEISGFDKFQFVFQEHNGTVKEFSNILMKKYRLKNIILEMIEIKRLRIECYEFLRSYFRQCTERNTTCKNECPTEISTGMPLIFNLCI